jgi:hypothetical protein
VKKSRCFGLVFSVAARRKEKGKGKRRIGKMALIRFWRLTKPEK